MTWESEAGYFLARLRSRRPHLLRRISVTDMPQFRFHVPVHQLSMVEGRGSVASQTAIQIRIGTLRVSTVRTATELSRKVRVPGYQAPGPMSEPPPAFLSVPVTVARKAVSLYHEKGVRAARRYLRLSKVSQWANHTNASMATSNSNVLSGFDAYVTADAADGRPVVELARSTVLAWPAGELKVRLDVILTDGEGLAGRALFWDGPDVIEAQAPLIAAPYATALAQLHPEALLTAIGIWQARRQTYIEVPIRSALRQVRAAQRLQFSL